MNRILLYAQNESDIYNLKQWLAECVAKRIKSGKEVSVEHLANCSTMQKITCVAAKICKRYGEPFTIQDRKEAAIAIAESVIEDAKFIINEK